MIGKEALYRLYVTEQKTGKEIALIAHVRSPETIYNWLRKYDIPRRSMRDAQRPITPSKEQIFDLYVGQELSIDNIARQLGSSESSISKLLDIYDIPKRPRWYKMGGWNKGKPVSKEKRAHLSEIAKQRTGKRSPRYGVHLSKKTRRKISDSLKGRFRGPANPQWKGGHRYPRRLWMARFEYKEWRNAVFARDNYTCQMCNKSSEGDIQAHHIRPWCSFPDLRFTVRNGIVLCKTCHNAIRGKELGFADKFDSILQANHQTQSLVPRSLK